MQNVASVGGEEICSGSQDLSVPCKMQATVIYVSLDEDWHWGKYANTDLVTDFKCIPNIMNN